MVIFMLATLIGGLWHRHQSGKDGQAKDIGRRFIQFVDLSWIIGAIVILAVASHIDKITVGTIFGAVAGYLFGMGRDDAQELKQIATQLRRVGQEVQGVRKHFTERES